MSSLNYYLWLPLAILVIILLILFLLIILARYRKIAVKNKLRHLKEMYQPAKLKALNAELGLLYVHAKSNEGVKQDYIRMKSYFERIEKVSKKIQSKLFSLDVTSRSKYKEFMKKAKVIDSLIKNFNNSIQEATKYTTSITQEGQFLRKEFVNNRAVARMLEEKYKDKRILLEDYANTIDEEFILLNDMAANITEYQSKAETSKIIPQLNMYREKISNLIQVLDYYPLLIIHINDKIRKIIAKTDAAYRKAKEQVGAELKSISYGKTILSIKDLYNEVKNNMSLLKAEEAVNGVKTIYKRIKLIIKSINHEVSARNMFLSLIKPSQEQTKLVYREFKKTQALYDKANADGLIKDSAIKNKNNDLINLVSLLKKRTDSNKDTFKTRSLSFSAKLLKLRLYINELIEIVHEINNLNKDLWDLSVQKTKSLNKLNQVKHAIVNISAEVRDNNISLEESLLSQVAEIEEEIINKIEEIKGDITFTDVDSVDDLVKRASEVYTLVARELMIAEMAKNVLLEIAHKVASNPTIGQIYKKNKFAYEEGKYRDSLMSVLDEMERIQ